MGKCLLILSCMAVVLATTDALMCYDGIDLGTFLKASQKDSCASCIKFGFTGAMTYACSPVSCTIVDPLEKIGFECCTNKDLCNSSPPVAASLVVNALLAFVVCVLC